MNRALGLVLMAFAWGAVVWGLVDSSAEFDWFGERKSVGYFAAPLILVAIWLLFRSQREDQDEGPTSHEPG